MTKKKIWKYSNYVNTCNGSTLLDDLNKFAGTHGIELKEIQIYPSEDGIELSAMVLETDKECEDRLKREKESFELGKENRRKLYLQLKGEFE